MTRTRTCPPAAEISAMIVDLLLLRRVLGVDMNRSERFGARIERDEVAEELAAQVDGEGGGGNRTGRGDPDHSDEGGRAAA